MMRTVAIFLLLLSSSDVWSRGPTRTSVDPWKAHIGFMAGMNTSIMQMTGGFGPHETSTVQWSAAFGLYMKTNQKNMFRFELQTGFEAAGAGREYYYQRTANEYVRIFDRYRTIPLTLILSRNFGWMESVSAGVGFKSSLVFSHSIRHPVSLNQTGIILTPDVLRWYGSVAGQISINLLYAEVAIMGWYAVTPVIDQYDIQAAPYGATLLVKARISQIGK